MWECAFLRFRASYCAQNPEIDPTQAISRHAVLACGACFWCRKGGGKNTTRDEDATVLALDHEVATTPSRITY
jgi:hypothetical protein